MNTETMNLERTSTKEEIKEFYRLKTVRTVENWMNQGLIPYVKIGKLVRFNLDEVKQAINESCGRNQGVAR